MTAPRTAPCAAPRHLGDDDPPPAQPHAWLCRPCTSGLRRDLRRLPALDTALQHLPVPRKGARGARTGLPISEPAADHRNLIRHDLTWWCIHVTEDRRIVHPPVTAHPLWSRDPVLVMAAWLTTHLGWIPYRDWAPDMAGAFADDVARARALIDPQITKRFAIPGPEGVCPDCGTGRIHLTIYASEGDRRRSVAACDACDREWLPETWLRLGQRITQRAAS